MINKVSPYTRHQGELIVVLVEGCGDISKHNYSGFRKGTGEYYEFESIEDWGKKFRRVMDRKYPIKDGETTSQWLVRISPRYNPEHRDEWLRRCGYWLNRLK